MKQSETTTQLLKILWQNATMGQEGTALLLKKTEDAELANQLRKYAAEYDAIKQEARTMLDDCGSKPEVVSKAQKAGLWMGVQMNTLVDKTSSHMAEMLINGAAMGIIKSEKNKRRNPEADPKALHLEDRLIRLEQEYIDTMKQFLQ